MSIFKEIPPTAGFSISTRELSSAFNAGRDAYSLENDFLKYIGASYARITTSGTAAFYIILEAVKKISPKKKVVIPAYTCPLVVLAIKRAGFITEVCDTSADSFDFDYAALERICGSDSDIAAIVATHLGGVPADIIRLKEITSRYNVIIIEDCAQSLGALYENRPVGSFGDFSFFSLCRGKGLTIYEGGVIVTTKREYIAHLEAAEKRFIGGNFLQESLKVAELFGYFIFYRPNLFWFAFKLPQTFWMMLGKPLKAFTEYYTVDFPLYKVSGIRKRVGHAAFYRLEGEINEQRKKADLYLDGLSGISGIKVIKESSRSRATYPFITVLFDDIKKKERIFPSLNDCGLGASILYLHEISGYEYLRTLLPSKGFPNAKHLAEKAMTLSTSIFLKDEDIFTIISKIKKLIK